MKSKLKSDPDAQKRYPKPAYFGKSTKSAQSAQSSDNSPRSSNKKSSDSKIILPAPVYDEMMRTRERLLRGEHCSRPELRRFLRVLRVRDEKIDMNSIRQFILEHEVTREVEQPAPKSVLVDGQTPVPIGQQSRNGRSGDSETILSEPESNSSSNLSSDEPTAGKNSLTISLKPKPTRTKSAAGKMKAGESAPPLPKPGRSTKSKTPSAQKLSSSAPARKPKEPKKSGNSSPVEP